MIPINYTIAILLFHGCFGTRISSPFHLATSISPIQNQKYPKNAINACANTQISPQPSQVLLRHCRLCCKDIARHPKPNLCLPLLPPSADYASVAWIRRKPGLLQINHFSREQSFKSMNEFSFELNRRCELSLLGRAHSVIQANGGYLENWIISPFVENCPTDEIQQFVGKTS